MLLKVSFLKMAFLAGLARFIPFIARGAAAAARAAPAIGRAALRVAPKIAKNVAISAAGGVASAGVEKLLARKQGSGRRRGGGRYIGMGRRRGGGRYMGFGRPPRVYMKRSKRHIAAAHRRIGSRLTRRHKLYRRSVRSTDVGFHLRKIRLGVKRR